MYRVSGAESQRCRQVTDEFATVRSKEIDRWQIIAVIKKSRRNTGIPKHTVRQNNLR